MFDVTSETLSCVFILYWKPCPMYLYYIGNPVLYIYNIKSLVLCICSKCLVYACNNENPVLYIYNIECPVLCISSKCPTP